jgi:hypothetical protein
LPVPRRLQKASTFLRELVQSRSTVSGLPETLLGDAMSARAWPSSAGSTRFAQGICSGSTTYHNLQRSIGAARQNISCLYSRFRHCDSTAFCLCTTTRTKRLGLKVELLQAESRLYSGPGEGVCACAPLRFLVAHSMNGPHLMTPYGSGGRAVIESGIEKLREWCSTPPTLNALSSAAIRGSSLPSNFSSMPDGISPGWQTVCTLEDMTDCAKERSARADDPNVNQ